jgi:hypothetical protein
MTAVDGLGHGGPPRLFPGCGASCRRARSHGDPDIGAALLDASSVDAENLMEQLVDAGLLDAAWRDGSGVVRYRLPGLLTLHALECADADEVPAELEAARKRVTVAQASLSGACCAM